MSSAVSRQQSSPRGPEPSNAASAVYFVFACVGALPVLAMLVYQYASVGSGAEYSCLTGHVPPDAVPYGPLRAWETAFPAGRYCEWESMSGGITTSQTGWIPTIVACVAKLLVVGMTVLAVRERRPRKIGVTLIPVIITLLIWIAVFL